MTSLTGTTLLLRQDLRRDRILVPAWVAVLGVMVFASASATNTLFDSAQERVRIATTLNDQPGLRALYGPILDPQSSGELAMSKMTVLYALISMALYVVVVRRHTRTEEETGRAELVGGTVVGRDAPLAAVVVECCAVAGAVGLLVAAANIAGGLPVAGSLWFGASWLGTGLVATGAAAVACQLSASARTCGSAAAGLLAGLFVVRAVGDAVDGLGWLSWLSPLGWNTQLRAWSGTRPWVVLLYVALAAGLLVGAQAMRGRRDIGAGLVGARPGPVDGRIAGPWTLALRLHRTSLALWTVAVAVSCLMFGAMAPGFDDLLSTGGGQELVDRLGGTFIAALVQVMAIAITCFSVAVAGAAHEDDVAGRVGWALSTSTTRRRWLGTRFALGWLASVWLLLVAGAALAAGYAAAGGSGAADAVPAALAWVPAVWLVGALALLGTAGRVGWAGWALFVLFLALTLVGELLELPTWLVDLSPYSVIPAYPAEAWSWPPVLVVAALALAAAAVATWVFDRRDLD